MTIPNLPTDNLYKFAALAGVAVTIAAMYLAVTSVLSVEKQFADTREQQYLAEANIDALEKRAAKLKELISNSIAENIGTYKPDNRKLELRYSEGEIKDLINRVDDLMDQVEKEDAKLNAAIDRNRDLLRNTKALVFFMAIALTTGLLMTWWGFKMWYRKVQVVQDELLRRDAELKNSL